MHLKMSVKQIFLFLPATDVSVFPRWNVLNDKCSTSTTAAKYMRMPQLNDNALNIELNNLAQQPTLKGH